jgi:hypothetical protein
LDASDAVHPDAAADEHPAHHPLAEGAGKLAGQEPDVQAPGGLQSVGPDEAVQLEAPCKPDVAQSAEQSFVVQALADARAELELGAVPLVLVVLLDLRRLYSRPGQDLMAYSSAEEQLSGGSMKLLAEPTVVTRSLWDSLVSAVQLESPAAECSHPAQMVMAPA